MVALDEERLAMAQKLLADMPKAVPKAAARAVNEAVAAAKAEVWRQIKKTYTVKRARVDKALSHTTRATAFHPATEIVANGPSLPLSYFRIKPKSPPKRRPRNPVYAQVRRDGGGPIQDAFVARMKSDHIGIFHRMQEGTKGKIFKYMKNKGPGATKGRAAIKQNFGLSVPQMLGNKTIAAFIEERAHKVLNERFTHHVNNILNGVMK